jgi:hypothetical protein
MTEPLTENVTISRNEYDQLVRDRAAYMTALRTVFAAAAQGANATAILKMIDAIGGVRPNGH